MAEASPSSFSSESTSATAETSTGKDRLERLSTKETHLLPPRRRSGGWRAALKLLLAKEKREGGGRSWGRVDAAAYASMREE